MACTRSEVSTSWLIKAHYMGVLESGEEPLVALGAVQLTGCPQGPNFRDLQTRLINSYTAFEAVM